MELNQQGIDLVTEAVSEGQEIEKMITRYTEAAGVPPAMVKQMLASQPGLKKSLEKGMKEAIEDTIEIVNAVLKDLDIYAD